jgi:predicted GIY-YIG superfamily endonuclease
MKKKWDKETIKIIASNYKTRNEFKHGNINAYTAARKKKWLNDVCSHMISGKIYWTKDKIVEISKKYKTLFDFRKYDLVVYKRASANGWLEEICKHMSRTENNFKRLIYAYEFSDNHVYVGLTYNEEKRSIEHNNNGPVFNHITKTKLIPIKKILSNGYVDVEYAVFLEKKLIENYRINNWILLNKKKGGELGGRRLSNKDIIKLKEFCHIEALKYKYRNELKKNNPKIYDKIKRHGWLNELCSHMEYKYKRKEDIKSSLP